jgi:hypothetical protein
MHAPGSPPRSSRISSCSGVLRPPRNGSSSQPSGFRARPGGKPHLTAPAPRTAERTPDLSGLWILDGFGLAANITDTALLPAAKALYQQRLQTYGHDDPIVHRLPEGPRTGMPGFDPLRIVRRAT